MKQEKTQQMIDLGVLNDLIIEIEGLLLAKNLNVLEKDLLLTQLILRVKKEKQKQATEDLMQSVSIGGLVKRFMKGDKNEDNTC